MVRFFTLCLFIFFCFIPSALSQTSCFHLLKEGKIALESKNFEKAIDCFSKVIHDLKDVKDYILLWRAKAYYGAGNYEEGLKDIVQLLRDYASSPLAKEAKKVEIEFLKKLNSNTLESAYESFLRYYPDELGVKLEYAQYLKEKGKIDVAKNYFKEIFLTASPLSEIAEKELNSSDITVNDLIKKAQNLKNAYNYRKAENYLLKALSKASSEQKQRIYKILGYSLFMQKRYNEAVEAFMKTGDTYWLGRAYLRAKDYSSFEKLIPKLFKSKDTESVSLLIHYANIKRRVGDTNEAIALLRKVISEFPHLKEEALWSLGWLFYKTGQFNEAEKIFKELYSTYRKTRYLYWLIRAEDKAGVLNIKNFSLNFVPGDYYSYLLYAKGVISSIPEPVSRINRSFNMPLRVEILLKAQLNEEALKELKWMINNNREVENIFLYAEILNYLGEYPTSIRLISKSPDRFNYHELLYPKPYYKEVIEAAKRFKVDPHLVFAIMREESRFDKRAVSVAGASGLMQLMYQTAKTEGKKVGILITSQEDLFDPQKNITVAVAYLKKLINEFKSIPVALAAYNAGENVVQLWLKEDYEIDEFIEDIPFSETKAYVQKVLTSYGEYLRANRQLSQNLIKVIKYKKEETDD